MLLMLMAEHGLGQFRATDGHSYKRSFENAGPGGPSIQFHQTLILPNFDYLLKLALVKIFWGIFYSLILQVANIRSQMLPGAG
jgi:hypothetical protein